MPFEPSYEVFDDRRPYLMEGSNVGVLFLHGFMGTPKSLRPLAQALAAQGLTVHAPLLPGHGHHPDKLKGVPMRDWLAEASEALATIRLHCEEVIVVGHSMGAIIGSYLANFHGSIQGIVLVAPPYEVPDWRLKLTPVLKFAMPWLEPLKRSSLRKIARERILDMYPEVNVDDPGLYEWLLEISRLPTSALDEMRKMFRLGRAQWPKLRTPALILQGERDVATKGEFAQLVFDKLPTASKELMLIPNGGHQMLRDGSPEMLIAWQKIFEFIEANSSTTLKSGAPATAKEKTAAD